MDNKHLTRDQQNLLSDLRTQLAEATSVPTESIEPTYLQSIKGLIKRGSWVVKAAVELLLDVVFNLSSATKLLNDAKVQKKKSGTVPNLELWRTLRSLKILCFIMERSKWAFRHVVEDTETLRDFSQHAIELNSAIMVAKSAGGEAYKKGLPQMKLQETVCSAIVDTLHVWGKADMGNKAIQLALQSLRHNGVRVATQPQPAQLTRTQNQITTSNLDDRGKLKAQLRKLTLQEYTTAIASLASDVTALTSDVEGYCSFLVSDSNALKQPQHLEQDDASAPLNMSMEFGEEDEFGGIEFEDDGMVASQSQDPLNTSSVSIELATTNESSSQQDQTPVEGKNEEQSRISLTLEKATRDNELDEAIKPVLDALAATLNQLNKKQLWATCATEVLESSPSWGADCLSRLRNELATSLRSIVVLSRRCQFVLQLARPTNVAKKSTPLSKAKPRQMRHDVPSVTQELELPKEEKKRSREAESPLSTSRAKKGKPNPESKLTPRQLLRKQLNAKEDPIRVSLYKKKGFM